jgi:diacylglycerol kinase (ATP)
MPWTVILNPAAGRGRSRLQADVLRSALAARRPGIDAAVEVSESGTDAIVRAEKAAAAGRDLVAAGGDGTVGALAGVAADSGCRLAIVPCGAGNDFAATLGYDRGAPLDALAALDDAHGVDVSLDLALALTKDGTRRWFCSVSACGFDSEANRWANTVQRLSGTTLYVAAVLRTLVTYRPHPLRITVDGDTHETRAWLAAIGNGPRYAGGMHIAPSADLTDGVLDCCVINDVSRAYFLRHFPKVFKGTHTELAEIDVWRGRSFAIESLDASVPIELYADGERIGALPASVEVRPDALLARVPRTSALAPSASAS